MAWFLRLWVVSSFDVRMASGGASMLIWWIEGFNLALPPYTVASLAANGKPPWRILGASLASRWRDPLLMPRRRKNKSTDAFVMNTTSALGWPIRNTIYANSPRSHSPFQPLLLFPRKTGPNLLVAAFQPWCTARIEHFRHRTCCAAQAILRLEGHI